MEQYGFIYIWYDTKRKMFYIGSHWGTEEDGYVCSSKTMRDNYLNRKFTFKRRIVSRIYTNRLDLLTEEQRWLDMINKEEFGRRYYNKNPYVNQCFWWTNEETKKQTIFKVSETKKKFWNSPEGQLKREAVRQYNKQNGIKPPSRKGKSSWNKGLSKETDARIAAASITQSKPKSNSDKMGRHGRMPPSQKGRRYTVIDGKRHYTKG